MTKTIGLPVGHDDKTSPYYVPEELRDYYRALPPVPLKDVSRVVETSARIIANSTVPEGTDPREYWNEVDHLVATTEPEGALHIHYLSKAASAYEKAAQYERRDKALLEKSRCPVCETVTNKTPDNPVARRSTRLLAPAIIEQPGDLHSCLKCYLAVIEARTALAASEKVGKVTRRQLVQGLLSTL